MGLAVAVRPYQSPWLLILLGMIGCSEVVGDGTCAEDSDCGSDQTCLVDLDREVAYCVDACISNDDCPAHQRCRIAHPHNDGLEQLKVQICVDKVRACAEQELCNGLDDDCDGVVDGPDCTIIDRCLDDASCGGWVCQAPPNQPTAICAPPVEAGAKNYEPCTNDSQCENGVCETGFCSAFCRPTHGCPSVPTGGDEYEMQCAEAIGDELRPGHNKCQISCMTDRSCPSSLKCLWRGVVQDGDVHEWVCAIPPPGRKAAGAMCTDNTAIGGDGECQSGLCYGQVCTHACGGFGANVDCQDVGPNYKCKQRDLFYGNLTFGAFLCVEGGS